MSINYDVYGQPETWDFSYINGGLTTDAAKDLKIQKAKVPRWNYNPDNTGYWNSQLREGITEGKITQNVPIDKTVCTVGMGEDCPFATIGYFRRTVIGGTVGDVSLDSIVRVGNGVVNGFLWEMRSDDSGSNYNLLSAGGGQIDEKQMTYRTWSPSSDNGGGSRRNGNYYIAPYTYYQLKTFIATIQVYVCNSADIPDDPEDITQVPTATWRSLDSWKNDYPTHKIIGLRVNFARANQIIESGGRITYTRPSPPSQYTYSVPCGFGILDELSFDEELQYKVYDYALFADGASWSTVIFKPFIDTVWNNSVHRIAFFGMYNVFSTYLRYLSGAVWYQIPYSEEIYDNICRAVATFGFIFVTDSTLTLPSAMNTNNICFPVINDEGIANGDYTRGTENLTNDIYNADSTRDKNYDPTKIDPNTYSNTTNWNNVNFRQAFTKRYLLTGSQVASLASELWAAQSSKPADIDYNNFAIDEYLTNNPIDTIVSLKYFPCTFADVAPAVVHLGKYTTNIAATALGTSVRIIDFAPIECFPHFNDFRDYEPYTELAMYIPFCGTVKIPTAECMGNYVGVKLAIDTNTGAATGYIIVSKTGWGGICVATCQGMAAIDIPVSGLQSANLANAVFNATANWTQTQINNFSANSGLFRHMGGAMGAIARGMTNSIGLSDVKGGVLGGPIGAAGTLVNSLNPITALQRGLNIDLDNAKADYELSHIQVPTRLVGSASPALGCVIELDCRLIIYRPVTDENALSNYADTVGFATVQGGTVSQFSGFTVGTIDVSGINATSKEKQAIAAAFANGVYL